MKKMSKPSKRVTYIGYDFSASNLYAAIIPSRHEAEKSIEEYVRLCEETLKQAYPNAEIEIFNTDQVEGSTNTLVYIQHDDQEVEDANESEVVESLCQQVYEHFEWFVGKNLMPIAELSNHHTDLPRSVVRWACTRGLIEGAGKPYGYWDVPLEALLQLSEHIEFVDCEKLIATSAHNRKACYLEDVSNVVLAQVPEQVEILLATRYGFILSLLESDTSSILVSRTGSQVHVSVEHYVDVEKWSHPEWPYPRYAGDLVEQAKRRGITSECQTDARNDSEVVDGVSFNFTEIIEPTTTMRELVDKVLQNLSEVVDAAEVSLAGGPVWDEIYEQSGQEALFCEKVLEPLLKKMGYVVRNIHGTDEYGRDFIFSKMTKFREPVYFALQAKVGSISGRANSMIDKLLGQIDDTFSMPYDKEPNKPDFYVSIIIIATSGHFTRNAVKKIRIKIPKHLVGSVYFWNKTKIQSLISHYWGRSNE